MTTNTMAEENVIGSILFPERHAFKKINGLVEPKHFTNENLRKTFVAMTSLYSLGLPEDDECLVYSQLERDGIDSKKFSFLDLHDIWAKTPTPEHIEHYAMQMLDSYKLRAVSEIVNSAADRTEESDAEADEIILDTEIKLKMLTSQCELSHGSKLANLAYDRLEQLQEGVQAEIIHTGFPGLNTHINGFTRGALVTIAARTSMGKTSFATSMAHLMAKNGLNVLFFTLEMKVFEITDRLISATTRHPLNTIRDIALKTDVFKKINKELYSDMDFTVFSPEKKDLQYIQLESRRLHQQKPIDVILVDQLSKITCRQKFPSLREKYDHIVPELKNLAQELNCVLILMHQLNREVDKANSRRMPQLSDLKESGRVEEESDVVILLHRPNYYDATANRNQVDVIVAKNRNGETMNYGGIEFVPEFALYQDRNENAATQQPQKPHQNTDSWVR